MRRQAPPLGQPALAVAAPSRTPGLDAADLAGAYTAKNTASGGAVDRSGARASARVVGGLLASHQAPPTRTHNDIETAMATGSPRAQLTSTGTRTRVAEDTGNESSETSDLPQPAFGLAGPRLTVVSQIEDPLRWRPLSGPGSRDPSEREAFLADRATDGLWLARTYGVTPAPRRRRHWHWPGQAWTHSSGRERHASRPPPASAASAPEHVGTGGEFDVTGTSSSDNDSDAGDSASDDAGDSDSGQAWQSRRDRGIAAILRELKARTRLPNDCAKLERAMRGADAAFNWDHAFHGRVSVSLEELRRLTAQRIAAAMRGEPLKPPRPVSDDLAAMWRGFPVEQIVRQADCWWVLPVTQIRQPRTHGSHPQISGGARWMPPDSTDCTAGCARNTSLLARGRGPTQRPTGDARYINSFYP